MSHRALILTVAVAVLTCAYAEDANADLCIRIAGGGNFGVIKTKYKLQFPPDPTHQNSCEAIAGFEDTSVPGGAGGRMSGSVCLDTDIQLTVHYTYHNAVPNLPFFKGYFESGLCVFDIKRTPSEKDPNVEGSCRGTVLAEADPGHKHESFVKPGWIWNCSYNVPRTNLPQ
jgi:hypothetical protein